MITQTSKNRVLVDSSFLYALADPNDKYRAAALRFARNQPQLTRIVPDVALTEVTHLLNKFIGHHAVIQFLEGMMALAERLSVSQICTFDQRDFSIFKPTDGEFLELLP